ncbi:MAG: rhodanese-like domain-containing protein [Tissierellia bacterium]|jgi:rhodanese-related sulfurtransferase|nr:rhodanese-like domain-containing protein [Tissierellia bacterium]
MKRILIILFIVILITIIFTGCTSMEKEQTGTETEYKKISAQEAKAIIESEDVIILDVRTQEEYNEGHIENSVLLPVNDISAKAEEILTDKDAKILVYCRSGNRSATASKQLIKMGYTNVYDFGGINSWPYEIIKAAK